MLWLVFQLSVNNYATQFSVSVSIAMTIDNDVYIFPNTSVLTFNDVQSTEDFPDSIAADLVATSQ